MAPKKSKTIKTKAKRVFAPSSKPTIVFDQIMFQTVANKQRFENLIQYRNIWPERKINLDELPLSFHRNLQCRKWLSLCKYLQPPPATLIREFYSNLHICSDDKLGTWIRVQSFVTTKNDVSNALNVPHVSRPTYPYSECPPISDVMILLCGVSSHVRLVTDASICFPSLFYQTLVQVHRSKCKKHGLFFPIFIYRVLNFLGLENFPSLELIHITAPIGATFLKQRSAQKKNVGPSVGSSKRPRVQSIAADVHAEESPVDPIATVADDGDDEVHVDSVAVKPTVPPPLTLRAMMETFMTTQAAHGRLLDGLIAEVATLKVDFSEYRSAFHLLHPLTLDDCL